MRARAVAAEAETAGAKGAPASRGDVADDGQVRAMLKQVEAAIRAELEALINNAGTTISTPAKELDAVSVEDWDRVFAVNGAWPVLGHPRRRAAS